jgi:MoxR-like ATPase
VTHNGDTSDAFRRPDGPGEPPTDRPGTPATPPASGRRGGPHPQVAEASATAQRVLDEVERAVVGKRDALGLVLAAILAKGHVLLEDLPGLGKTLAARSFARALGLDFTRAQFTPDLLPADLTGSFLYDQRDRTFEFRKGPLFTGLLLADEVNRTPPKTQSALLEAMQERQVTVEGETFPLPEPFHVLATANPIEYEGTYPLPEAQLDRFLLRVRFGYPSGEEEYDVIARRLERRREEVDLDQVTDAGGLRALQAAVETVTVDASVGRYCVDLVAATRSHGDVLTGASPRGSLGLVLAARGFAVLRGRDYVIPEDVKAVARSVLAHRITVRPELWMTDASGSRVVDQVLASVATPATLERSAAGRS